MVNVSSFNIKPLVSIIVPVFNAERYLKNCLDSLIAQTLNEIEILCINDGSTDNSLEILSDYSKKDSRIRIFNQKNAGPGMARNTALDNAKGEYIYFLDSDDYITSDYLQGLYDIAKETGSAIVVNPVIILSYPNMQKQLPEISYKEKTYCITPEILPKITGKVYLWNRLFRIDLLKLNDIKFPNIIIAEDLYFYYCLMPFVKQISISQTGIYYYRQSPSQATRTFVKTTANFFINTFKLIKQYYRENNLENKWQVPVYCLFYQLHYNTSLKTFSSDYKNIKMEISDTILHQELLSDQEKRFIKSVNRGYFYCFLTICIKLSIINFIRSILSLFFHRL
jgi:glycosyltransferase involved in cell wall biosynthesis